MSTSSVDETKTGPKASEAHASPCCGGDANADSGEQTHAHGSCATHERAHTTTATSTVRQSRTHAGHHRNKSGCCGG